jgi:hypothetical protein
VWERKVLRTIFGAVCEQGEWHIRMNDEIHKLYGELELVAEVKKRRLQYLGHVVRMEEDRISKKILDQHPGGRRKPGKLRKRWLYDVTKDLEVLGLRGWRRWALDRKEWVKACRRGQGPSWTVGRGNDCEWAVHISLVLKRL